MFSAKQISCRAIGRYSLLRRLWMPAVLMPLVALQTAWPGGEASAETPPKPSLQVTLSELGFPGYAVSLFHAGASMATVHALDSTHVLFTYSLRSLVPRLPGDDANDTDRQVAAVLVEIPSGKVLARTKWHLHDHGRYLWSAGRGVFVLRSGNELSVLAPLRGLAAGVDPFRRYALPHRPGQPVLVGSSPDGQLITLELEADRPKPVGDDDAGDEEHLRKHYVLEFFRLATPDDPNEAIQLAGAGVIGSPVLLRLAVDGDGYLWAEDDERGKWTVSFNEFGGKQEKLAPVLSSCNPRLSLLSRSEFLVETCRGTELAPMLASFGFDGHENWQEQLGDALQPPTLALAPAAGRFAMSRLSASASGAGTSSLSNDDPISQEIRVYQTESGDMLLHLQCVPAVRSAENFDLSPDGKMLVVLAAQTLDVYKLPELTPKDKQDLAEVQTMTPPVGSGPVVLARITRPVEAPESVDGGETVKARDHATVAGGGGVGAVTAPTPAPAPAVQAKAAAAPPDSAPEAPRKPPTLLSPGESAEYKGQAKTQTPE